MYADLQPLTYRPASRTFTAAIRARTGAQVLTAAVIRAWSSVQRLGAPHVASAGASSNRLLHACKRHQLKLPGMFSDNYSNVKTKAKVVLCLQ